MSDSYKRYRLYFLYPLLVIATASIVFVYIGMVKISIRVRDITHLWETKPIVSIYVPAQYQQNQCAQGYQPVAINNNISAIGAGPCGCAQNALGFLSSNQSCAYTEENSNICTSLSRLPQLTSLAWRESTVCIKRAGKAAASFQLKYKGRHHPNKQGYCPSGYRKCGQGLNQQQGAICFPTSVECPITNMIMLPSEQAVPANEGWESAGEFLSANLTLYVRRQYLDELPVVDLVFQLTEYNNKSENVRGRCYDHPKQLVNASAVANPNNRFDYDINLPKTCKTVDPRYLLVDQMPLQDHFLQNLQLTEPACEGFALYALSDPRYQPALDPDYLNSGVQCDFTSKYTCVRDPYQRTNCAADDSTCNDVVNQNICGEYAHAVRSALGGARYDGMGLGMYFAREVQWTDGCKVGKSAFQELRDSVKLCMAFSLCIAIAWVLWVRIQEDVRFRTVRFMWEYSFCLVILVAAILTQYTIVEVAEIYYAVAEGTCTDTFTANNLLHQLEPIVLTFDFAVVAYGSILLLAVESFVLAMVTQRHSMVMLTNSYDCGERRYILVPIGTNPHNWRPPGYAYNPLRTQQAAAAPEAAAPAAVATVATAPTIADPPVEPALAKAELGWAEQNVDKNCKEHPHVDWV